MAYRDIEMWRQILEQEEQEKTSYDEACERRAAERRALQEKEFWDCDQKEIDPKTLGFIDETDYDEAQGIIDSVIEKTLKGKQISGTLDVQVNGGKILAKLEDQADPEEIARRFQEIIQTESDYYDATVTPTDGLSSGGMYEFYLDLGAAPFDGPDGWEDYDGDYDESIDFSQYKLDEADMREPITAVTSALGRPASTANLDAQDSVLLAEAIRELAKAVKSRRLNEAEADGEAAPEGDDVPDTTDDYEKMKAAENDSKEALRAAQQFYTQWISDPTFRRRAALKTKEGAVKRVPQGYWKKGQDGQNEITTADDPDAKAVAGTVVAGTDPNSELAQKFKGYFDRMSDVDKEIFDAWASRQRRRFTAAHWGPQKADPLNKRGDLHGKGGDDDDDVNPLAQHGLDQTFNPDNADDIMIDDPDAGEEFYSQFDQDAVSQHDQFVRGGPELRRRMVKQNDGSFRAETDKEMAARIKQQQDFWKNKTVADLASIWGRRHGQGSEEDLELFKKFLTLRAIRNTVQAKGKNGRELTDWEVEYIFNALEPEQQAELKSELLADAGDDQNLRTFIEYLFRFGKERKVTLLDILKKFGVAGDQSGRTGEGTQLQDRHVGMLVQALAQYFEVDEDDIPDLKRTCYSQAPTRADRQRGIEPRSYSRHLICKITQDLINQFRGPNMPQVTVPQSPAKGPKIRGKEWEDVKRKLAGFLALLKLKMKEPELREVALEIDRVFREKYGDMDAEGNHLGGGTAQIRKFVTYLKKPQQDEFLKLLEKVRENYDELTDEEKLRIVQLNRMRLGDEENTALRKAERAKVRADRKNAGEWDTIVKKAAKGFLAGQSGNLTRDGIDVANPYEGTVNNGPNAQAPGEYDGLHEAMMREALEAVRR